MAPSETDWTVLYACHIGDVIVDKMNTEPFRVVPDPAVILWKYTYCIFHSCKACKVKFVHSGGPLMVQVIKASSG